MSESKAEAQLRKTKRFSKFRCVGCRHYLVPCTEEKMNLFDFTSQQRQKVREYGLTHFCPRCMRGYQRAELGTTESTE